eukprot:COSAG05_NODE_2250_length_3338_cov_7.489349_2_plen_115_part_00
MLHGQPINISDFSGAVYNDVPWAMAFIAVVLATCFLAVNKQMGGSSELEQESFCDSAPCKNGATCQELNAAINGRVGFLCECASGWIGPQCSYTQNETASGIAQEVCRKFDPVR